jgi:hypothetical protein
VVCLAACLEVCPVPVADLAACLVVCPVLVAGTERAAGLVRAACLLVAETERAAGPVRAACLLVAETERAAGLVPVAYQELRLFPVPVLFREPRLFRAPVLFRELQLFRAPALFRELQLFRGPAVWLWPYFPPWSCEQNFRFQSAALILPPAAQPTTTSKQGSNYRRLKFAEAKGLSRLVGCESMASYSG